MKLFASDSKFYKNVCTLALPIAGQSAITVGVNLLDNVMVGKLGEIAMSGVSQASAFISIYHIFCMGLGMGASVLVSRYWGMKRSGQNEQDASVALKQTVCLMLRITMLLASVFAVLTLLYSKQIMGLYTNQDSVVASGAEYLKYSVITYFFLGASLTTTIVLRSVGQAMLPLFVSIGAFFVNLAANYAFIFGKFGAPRMEVAGAAVGTLIARVFEAICIVGYLLVVDRKICFRIRDFFMKTASLLREYVRICVPVLLSDGILAFGNSAVAMVIGHLGDRFVAANSITQITQQISTVVIQGVSQAGAIVTGQTLGEGDKEKAMNQGWLFLGLGIGLGIISALIITAISGPIISLYSVSEETIAIAKQLMLTISFIIIFQATNSIMTKGVLRGGGDTLMLVVFDNIFLWLIALPLGIAAGYFFKLPAFGIYVFLKSDQIVKAVWCVLRLKSGKWIKKISTKS